MSWAILQELGGKQMLVQLKGRTKVGKQAVRLSSNIEFNRLYKVSQGEPEPADLDLAKIEGPIIGNNKDFYDDNTAQTLTPDQIQNIKSTEGGQVLIDKLIENSSTFQMKTQFAQEKYIKKKKNKHLSLFRILKPTCGNIADTLYLNRPQKGIRSDALFNLLGLSNIHYFSKVLISEYTGGVVLGSVLERTSLSVTSLYTDGIKDHALKYFGHSKKANPRMVNSKIEEVIDQFDSLIITTKDGLLELLQQTLPKLKGSGAFAAYQQDIVDAARSYEWIMSQGLAANVSFEEIWTREFQVLPERTHPDVKNRIGTSAGYIVSGIKLDNEETKLN